MLRESGEPGNGKTRAENSAAAEPNAALMYLNLRRQYVRDTLENIALGRKHWIANNLYYYEKLKHLLGFIVEPHSRVLQIRCDLGHLLHAVAPSEGVGIDCSSRVVKEAQRVYPQYKFLTGEPESLPFADRSFDYVILPHVLGEAVDAERALLELHEVTTQNSRIVVIGYNYLWLPIVKISEKLGLKVKQPTHNWLSLPDIENLLHLAGFEPIKQFHFLLMPKYLPVISSFLNLVLGRFPIVQKLCFVQAVVARRAPVPRNPDDCSVSIIIPCKNERENIEAAVRRIPSMGKHLEIIFCDDKSTDGTADEVRRMQYLYPEKDIKLLEGPGVCKARNVWTGLDAANGEVLMILDADLTTMPEELPYFLKAAAEGKGDFINGSRLIYPLQDNAMNPLNVLGNKFFSLAFTYLLGQRIKDTLCGTKVFWREDYRRMKKLRGSWGVEDPWGDFELLFSAAKLNLKIVEMPVHYMERTSGVTKMTKRFRHGMIMLRMCLAALLRLKFF